jgi:hypothetical protein
MATSYDDIAKQLFNQQQQPSNIAEPENPYDRIVQQDIARQTQQIKSLSNLTPEQHAQTIKIEKQTGLPTPVIERNAPEIQKRLEERQKFQFAQMLPALDKVYQNGKNLAGIVQNDLSKLYDAVSNPLLKNGVSVALPDGSHHYFTRRPTKDDFPVSEETGFAAASQNLRAAQDAWDAKQQQGTIEPVERSLWDEVSDPFVAGYKRFKRAFSNNLNDLGVNFNDDVYARAAFEADRQRQIEALAPTLDRQAQIDTINRAQSMTESLMLMTRYPAATREMFLNSLGTTAPALGMTVATGVVGGPWSMAIATGLTSFTIEYGTQFEQVMTEMGYNPNDAMDWATALQNQELVDYAREKGVKRGIPIALFDAATARLAGVFMRNTTASPTDIFNRASGEVALQAFGGGAGEATAQVAADEKYNPSAILLEALAEIPTAIPEGFINYVKTQREFDEKGRRNAQRARNANSDAENLRQIANGLSESEAIDQGVEGRQAIVEVLNQSAPDTTVTLSAGDVVRILKENGTSLEDIQETAPEIAKQLPDAAGIGGEIVIPIGELLGTFAQTEMMDQLIDVVRTSPDAMTLQEAQEFAQSGNEELRQEMETTVAGMRDDEEFNASKERVRQLVLEELNKAGRFTQTKNEMDAILIASRTATRAAQLGLTPEEFFNQQFLRVNSDINQSQGQTLDQSSPEFGAWFNESQVKDEEGAALPVWHVSKVDSPDVFDPEFKTPLSPFGFHFGTRQQAETRATHFDFESETPSLNEYYLSIQNPFMVSDHRGSYAPDFLAEDMANAGLIDMDQYDQMIDETFADEIELGQKLVEILKANGFDGIVYENTKEGPGKSWVPFDPQQIKSVNNSGNYDPANPSVYNQFVGMDSKTADLGNLQKAMDMAEEGRSNNVIRQQTGWFKGVDGLWRYEISDDQAKFIGGLNDKDFWGEQFDRLLDAQYDEDYAPPGYRWQQRDMGTHKIWVLLDSEGIPENSGLHKSEILREYGYLKFSLILKDILDHPLLFAAYPDLANMQIKASDNSNGAFYNPMNDTISLGRMVAGPNIMSVLMHELQHAIQQREGYAKGGSNDQRFADAVGELITDLRLDALDELSSFNYQQEDQIDDAYEASRFFKSALRYESYRRLIDYADRDEPGRVFRLIRSEAQWLHHTDGLSQELKDRAKELSRKFWEIPKRQPARNQFLQQFTKEIAFWVRDTIDAKDFKAFKEDPRQLKSMVKALARQATKKSKVLQEQRELENRLKKWQKLEQFSNQFGAMHIYRHLAGEIEARLTETRLRYTEEQRGSRAPTLDMDVPAEEAIVIMGSGQMALPYNMNTYGQSSNNRGSFNPGTNTINLYEASDLSTFLHEAGHYFFENDIRLAADLLAVDDPTEGQMRIMQDVSALLKWHGIQGTLEEQIAAWALMDFEERRTYHERTAESFERYLMTGKAPSVQLQRVFQTFRAWLLSVYKSAKDFVTRYPESKKLNPEVREIFDRMLATEEEIRIAQEARSMLPLFDSPQAAGMTEAEWAAYQDENSEATEEAKDELDSKGARDMQWTQKRLSKELKKLQRLSGETRKQVRMEVRSEVMSQPVYRVWSFLTGKLTPEDKLNEPTPPRKSVKGAVDPSVDTLFTAIAKYGGLDRDEVTSQWGLDPKTRSPMPLFGLYVLKRDGGLSIDKMAESLAQDGYLELDENGKPDVRDLEAKFDDSLRGEDIYSNAADYNAIYGVEGRPGDQVPNPAGLLAGRLDLLSLREFGLTDEQIQRFVDLRMTAKTGLHPDIVADLFGYTSGDQMIQELLNAEAPVDAIEGRVDQIMLEQFGELATPEAMEQAASAAVHNEVRARMLATELEALGRSIGRDAKERRALVAAADEFARQLIGRTKVNELNAGKFDHAATRAARMARAHLSKGRRTEAYAEKRNQILNSRAARATHEAKDYVEKAIKYLKKFSNDGTRKKIDPDYLDQIDTLLERFDLRQGVSGTAINKRKALAAWIEEQEDMGIEVDIPDNVRAEAFRQSFKDMTVEELRGLVDTIKQIEHLGRLKDRLLTLQDNRRFQDVVKAITQSIEQNASGVKDNRTRDTLGSRAAELFKGYLLEHRKIASLAREMDGLVDGGPMWEFLIQTMNAAGDREATMRAEATRDLMKIIQPLLKGKKMGGKGTWFPQLGTSLNRGERIVIALNMGNEGNAQRLMDGFGWDRNGIQAVLDTLTAQELDAVQAIWDFFESYRPMIAAKERRVMGKEPEWVKPVPLQAANGSLRGGYFPIVYDPRSSGKAEQFADAEAAKREMRGAFVASTTRRSFTKTRSEAVKGRPLMLTFAGLFRGANEVIHDLAWHEWVIDANRILRNGAVDQVMRRHYGADAVKQFKLAVRDIAAGELPGDGVLEIFSNHLRSGAAIAGLGFNLLNSFIQPLGLTQSMVRVGTRWVLKGMIEWTKSPIAMVNTIRGKSEFMAQRTNTMQRELNELQSVIQGKGQIKGMIDKGLWFPMQMLQLVADVPTWWGAYQKALTEAPLNMDAQTAEERAIRLADQAVIDSQSGGQTKDLAAIQRGAGFKKLFTVFYGFFSAAYNLSVETTKNANFKNPADIAKLIWDYLLLLVIPSVGYTLAKEVLQPGDGDDEDLAEKLIADQMSYLMGMFVGLREFTGVAQTIAGVQQYNVGYSGPAGLRFIGDTAKLGQQISQGDVDRPLLRAVVNVASVGFHLPGAQINRTIDGIIAINEGDTQNPAALLFGAKR